MGPPPIPLKQNMRITPNQHKALARLSRRKDLAEPILKEDLLGLAGALKAGLETFDILRLRVGILRWFHANNRLFSEWFFEIREVYPYFLDVLLRPPPSRCHCRRNGIKPGACRSAANRRQRAPMRRGMTNAPERFPGMDDPIPEHFVLPDLPTPQGDAAVSHGHAYRGTIFSAPLPMEPEAFCGPTDKHPWTASSVEMSKIGPLLVPTKTVPPGVLLPEPGLPQSSQRQSVPILRLPVPNRTGAASTGRQVELSGQSCSRAAFNKTLAEANNQRDWQILERTSVRRMTNLLKDGAVIPSGSSTK